MASRPSTEVSRRAVLASLAGGASALTGGCLGRMRSLTGWQSPSQVTLRIKTLPDDADPYALRIARDASGWFRRAGIDARVTPMGREELYRDVLLNEGFDVFVARAPGHRRTPDALYPLLHSRFAATRGWQNPFGYTNLDVDRLLSTQRRTEGGRRREAVGRVLRQVGRTQPFTVVGFPDEIRAARSDRFDNWESIDPRSPVEYLTLERAPDSRESASGRLRAVTTDGRATENLNPLAVEFRRHGDPVDLIYDSLGRYVDGRIVPWLAASWAFSDAEGRPTATLQLREGATWHDGKIVTPEDVMFTYAFLADTTLGSGTPDDEGPIPAPRFQGRLSLVSEVRPTGPRSVEFRFVECEPAVATRAFTVPVLPEHVWRDRTGAASVGGIEVGGGTEALVATNVPPVGSGPLAFVRNTPQSSLVLEPYGGHFLVRGDVSGAASRFAGAPAFDRLVLRAIGSDVTAVEVVANGDADVTWGAVGADTVARIGRASDLDLLVDRSDAYYLVGYNARRPPLTNPRFRHALARLIDQEYLVDDVFDGYAEPAASPLAGTGWQPPELRWEGDDPIAPFPGSDGELDVERARRAFRTAGYRYADGKLVED